MFRFHRFITKGVSCFPDRVMAEEDVIATCAAFHHKRKLENVETEILEQHTGSIDQSNEASADSAKEASEYSQEKRPKLDGEADDGCGEYCENKD
ncbi:hypothetical protein Bca52824_000629 [Brassica carinata]|uniref:Uncharacterized protein n=1 Tax=Brassica carinata TaxID=52824 RepID=A0A8X7WGS1_BRACI|nr:hypothetical protein Bca52824_000629 [Brassica carinata]